MAKFGKSGRFSRRQVLTGGATAAVGGLSLAIVGCGGDDDDNGGSTGAGPTSTPSNEQPKQGGVLRVGQIGGDVAFNIGFPFVSYPQNRYLQESVTESLVRYRDSLEPELLLVDRYEYNEDRTKLTASLKPDLKFHNGDPVTPEDVFFGIDLIVDPASKGVTGNFQLVNFAKMIVEKKALDERTMEFTFDKPRMNMDDFFAQLKVTQASNYDKLVQGQDVQGTGPYKFASWTPGQGFRVERNPDYHYADVDGGPYLDAIEGVNFADADAAGLAFEAGDIDLINSLAVTGTVAKRFRDKGQTRLSPKTGLYYAGAVVTNPLLADKRVRQALFLAVDRQRIQEEIGEGFSEITVQPWPDTSPAFDPALQAPFYDPEKAKSLLEEAGFSQSAPLKLEYSSSVYGSQAEILQQNWDAIGVKVELHPMEANAFTAKFAARELTDLFISGHSFSDMTPLTNFQQTFPYRIPNIGYFAEPGSSDGEEYRQIIAELETLEPLSEEAKAVYARFNQLFLDEAWLIPFGAYARIDLYGSKVRGVEYMIEPGAGSPNFALLWKA